MEDVDEEEDDEVEDVHEEEDDEVMDVDEEEDDEVEELRGVWTARSDEEDSDMD